MKKKSKGSVYILTKDRKTLRIAQSEFLDDDRDDDIDEDLARYSVFQDPEFQRLRAEYDRIRQNPQRR